MRRRIACPQHGAIAATLSMAAAGPALASYGQMKLDLWPLLAGFSVFCGLLLALIEWLDRRFSDSAGWNRFLLAAAALGLLGSVGLALLPGWKLAIPLVPLLIVFAPIVLARLPFRAWLRGTLLLLIAAALYAAFRSGSVSRDVALLIVPGLGLWALIGALGRDTDGHSLLRDGWIRFREGPSPPRRSDADRHRDAEIGRRFDRWEARLHRPYAALKALLPGAGGRDLNAMPLLRILLWCLASYGLGVLIMVAAVQPVAGILLSMASRMPGAPEPPVVDEAAALAYWLSYGLAPSLLLATLAITLSVVAKRPAQG